MYSGALRPLNSTALAKFLLMGQNLCRWPEQPFQSAHRSQSDFVSHRNSDIIDFLRIPLRTEFRPFLLEIRYVGLIEGEGTKHETYRESTQKNLRRVWGRAGLALCPRPKGRYRRQNRVIHADAQTPDAMESHQPRGELKL
jgi:hypothetical protein